MLILGGVGCTLVIAWGVLPPPRIYCINLARQDREKHGMIVIHPRHHPLCDAYPPLGGDDATRPRPRRASDSLPWQRQLALREGELGGVSWGRSDVILSRVCDGGESPIALFFSLPFQVSTSSRYAVCYCHGQRREVLSMPPPSVRTPPIFRALQLLLGCVAAVIQVGRFFLYFFSTFS